MIEIQEKDGLLKIYDYALQKATTFSGILISEIFGTFAILTLLTLDAISPMGRLALSVVFWGTIVAITITYMRAFHYFFMTDIISERLTINEGRNLKILHGEIEVEADDRLAKSGRLIKRLQKASNFAAKRWRGIMILGWLIAFGLWVIVYFRPIV